MGTKLSLSIILLCNVMHLNLAYYYDYYNYGDCNCDYYYSNYNPCCMPDCAYCDPIPVPAIPPCTTYCVGSWACCDSQGGGYPVTTRPGYCPVLTASHCKDILSESFSKIICSKDDECPGKEKCCDDPCIGSKSCTYSVSRPTDHAGVCPPIYVAVQCPQPIVRPTTCTSDVMCFSTSKCCYDACERDYVCTSMTKPTQPKPQTTAAPLTTAPATTAATATTAAVTTAPATSTFCPVANTCGSSSSSVYGSACNQDQQCSSNEKCCLYKCLNTYVCLKSVAKPDEHLGQCPGTSTCANAIGSLNLRCTADTDCDLAEKCCSCQGQNKCIKTTAPGCAIPCPHDPSDCCDNAVKTGTCPTCLALVPSAIACTQDYECADEKKCCSCMTNMICTDPTISN